MELDILPAQETSSEVIDKRDYPDITYEAQQARVQAVAELLEKGTRSTAALIKALAEQGISVSRPTVIKYRNYALNLIAEETKPMNRDHLRNLEVGRLGYWIEQLTGKINGLDWSVLDKDGTPVAFYMYDKMLQRLKDMGDQLHKITGLNTDVHVNIDEKRRTVFIRPSDTSAVKDTGATHGISNNDNNHVSEGQIISQ